MDAGAMADSPARPLKRSEMAWALEAALRFAIGTCVVALLVATTLSGEAAERFATVAYLAAIFAALTLAVGRFVPWLLRQMVMRSRDPSFRPFLAIPSVVRSFWASSPRSLRIPAESCSRSPAAPCWLLRPRSCAAERSRSALGRCMRPSLVADSSWQRCDMRSWPRLARSASPRSLRRMLPKGSSNSHIGLIALATLFLAASLLAPTSTGVLVAEELRERGGTVRQTARTRPDRTQLRRRRRRGNDSCQSSARAVYRTICVRRVRRCRVRRLGPRLGVPAIARLTAPKYLAVAAAMVFAGFLVARGVPTLRHDWNWPIDRGAVPSFVQASIYGWLSAGFGMSNPHPTTYLIALPIGFAMWLVGPLAALALLGAATGYLCMRCATAASSHWKAAGRPRSGSDSLRCSTHGSTTRSSRDIS